MSGTYGGRAIAVLKDRLPDVERQAVAVARRRGAMWSRIGEALGRSRQAIYQKYGPGSPPPLRPPTRDMVERRLAWLALQADLERRAEEMFARWDERAR